MEYIGIYKQLSETGVENNIKTMENDFFIPIFTNIEIKYSSKII
jgi:hypothetical protein